MSAWGTNSRTITNKYQLEKGGTATEFEPYTGGQPSPNPNYPQEIISCGDLITDSQDENYGKYKIPVNVRSDNLINNTLQSQTKNGITLTRNIDGSVTANGTATSNAFFDVGIFTQKQGVAYTLSGCPQGGGNNKYRLYLLGESTPYFDDGEGKNFPIINTDTQRTLRLAIYNNMTVKNLTFYPMIRLTETGNVKYQPYYNETTNIYLDEPLRKSNDGTCTDYIDFKNSKVIRNNKEIALNGSESVVKAEQTQTYYRFGMTTYNNIVKKDNAINCFSNMFLANSSKNVNTFYIATTTGNLSFSVPIDFISSYDVNAFLSKLQQLYNNGTPVIINIPLSTPTEESIILPNIPTIDGNNTLNIETEITPSQVYIKYKSNT